MVLELKSPGKFAWPCLPWDPASKTGANVSPQGTTFYVLWQFVLLSSGNFLSHHGMFILVQMVLHPEFTLKGSQEFFAFDRTPPGLPIVNKLLGVPGDLDKQTTWRPGVLRAWTVGVGGGYKERNATAAPFPANWTASFGRPGTLFWSLQALHAYRRLHQFNHLKS